MPPAVELQRPNHWTAREVPPFLSYDAMKPCAFTVSLIKGIRMRAICFRVMHCLVSPLGFCTESYYTSPSAKKTKQKPHECVFFKSTLCPLFFFFFPPLQ